MSETREPAVVGEIRKVRTNALYEKKKHYNAADRKAKYRMRLGIPPSVIRLGLGS